MELKAIESATAVIGNVHLVYPKDEADKVIADLEDKLQAANKQLENIINSASSIMLFQDKVNDNKCTELNATKRALWLMTAEWAEAMGLASCNIANKFMSRENFEVSDDYRNNTVKKYRHRQVVFYKYADYCRHKAEEYK